MPGRWWSGSARRASDRLSSVIAFADLPAWRLGWSPVGRGRTIKRFRGRFGGSEGVHAIEELWLFVRVGAVVTRRSNLWLSAGGPSRTAFLAGLFVVILNRERVICNYILEEKVWKLVRETGRAHPDCHLAHWKELSFWYSRVDRSLVDAEVV